MTSQNARLARMAGQIAAALHAVPEADRAAAVAAHINQFWAPPMRRALAARLGSCDAALDPAVRGALSLIHVPPDDR